MAKTLILQVNIKQPFETRVGNRKFNYIEDLYQLSHQQAKHYAVKTGSDYIQVTDDSYRPGLHPIWQRFKMFDLYKPYDSVLYLDSDVIVLPQARNIFALYAHCDFSAVPNFEYHRDVPYIKNELRKEQKRYKSSNKYIPFCSGVMLMSNSWIEKVSTIWEKYVPKYQKVSHDQGVLNSCVIELGETYNQLDYNWGQWNKNGNDFIHLGFWRKNNFDKAKFCRKYNI